MFKLLADKSAFLRKIAPPASLLDLEFLNFVFDIIIVVDSADIAPPHKFAVLLINSQSTMFK